jgi:GT2 family glycosyltransferase
MHEPVSFAAAIPVGSWHDFLPRSLESLAIQTPPLQVALLDASGDPRVADAAQACGLKFAYLRTGPDGGQSAAIAEGWNHTESDFVFWLNADDCLLPDALDHVRNAVELNPALDVVYGLTDFVDIAGNVTEAHDQVDRISPMILRSNIISQPSCFARRSAVTAVGGVNPDLQFVMDWDLWVRLYQSGAKFEMLQHTLSTAYMGNGTKTHQVSMRRLQEVFRLVNRNKGIWSATKSTLALAAETLSRRKLTA